MQISLIEKKLIESIKKDLNSGKSNILKIGILSSDGVGELIHEKKFLLDLRKLNSKTASKVIHMIQNNEILSSQDEFEKYNVCSYVFEGKNLNFIRKHLKDAPLLTTYYLLNNMQLFEEAIKTFSVQEQEIIFDSYFTLDKNGLLLSYYDIYKYMINLTDEAKIKYMMNSVCYMNFEELDVLFDSFKSHQKLIEAIDIFYDKTYINEFVNVFKYLSSDEVAELIKPKLAKNCYNAGELIKKLSFEQKIDILNYLIVNDTYNVSLFANMMVDEYVKNNNDLNIYNILNKIFDQNKISTSLLDLEAAKTKINDMSGEELLNLYISSSFEPIKQYIKSSKDLWQKEPLLSYLIENDLSFICKYVFRESSLTDMEKELFLNKDIVYKMADNLFKNSEFEAIVYRYQNLIGEYFKDEEFAHKLLRNIPRVIEIFYTLEMDVNLIRFAFDNGYIPFTYLYDKFKDNKDVIDAWLSCIKDFDAKNESFSTLFNNLVNVPDFPLIQEILLQKAADNLNMPFDVFLKRFEALKKVNSEILSTLDYRLFDEKFPFLSTNKIEILGANKIVSSKLCSLSINQLKVIKDMMSFSSSINWIDLLDRILNNIYDYIDLIDDLADKVLDINEISLLTRMMVHNNFLKIKTYEDLKAYDDKLDYLIKQLEKSEDIEKYKELNALCILGIDYKEFSRIYSIYCSDLEQFCKLSKNEDLKNILKFVKKVSECNSIDILKDIYNNTPKLKVSSELIINLDAEIRREFLKLYNETLYKVNTDDKLGSKSFNIQTNTEGKVMYVPSNDGEISVEFYSPIGLGDEQKEFSLIMTSLGAYSEHEEPDDYYASWNVDLIQSHGFCCSYLKNDNLGTARICHACLGFNEFDLDSLLLSAPYDIGSATANTKFNTSREMNTRFCTPRGMVNATRHTHNEMVFERRNLTSGGSFKKEPAYAVFFCNDFNKLTDSEKSIYESTVKAAIQLGRNGKALPVIVVERLKIAKYQYDLMNKKVAKLIEDYEPGQAKELIVSFVNNRIGNTYADEINDKYFNSDFQKYIIDAMISKIIDLREQGLIEESLLLYNEIDNAIKEERKNGDSGISLIFRSQFDKLKKKMQILNLNKDNDSQLLRNLLVAFSQIEDDKCLKRFNEIGSIYEAEYFIDNAEILDILLNEVDMKTLSAKLKELEEDNIYVNNSPHNNRYIANKFLYSLMILEKRLMHNIDINMVLDVIKYQRCSFMDGASQKNVLSSINKAEKMLNQKGYDQSTIDKIKLLIFLQDKKDINEEMVNEIIQRNQLNTIYNFNLTELQEIINIIHDVECLAHARFVTADEVDKKYFFDERNFNFTKLSYQLEESFAMMDIKDYAKNNFINESSYLGKANNPQEVIRSIRKGKTVDGEYKNNTYENAFLEIDVAEKTNPLNLISKKMKNYGELPQQLSLIDFYSQILKMPNYSYLNKKIEIREDLYLNCSEIHGATHANNVSLFATYIANSIGLSDNDVKTIIEASIYHDIGRTSDSVSNNHGEVGAVKYGAYVECPNTINSNEVKFLIEAHALPSLKYISGLFNKYNFDDNDKERLYRMATVIRDADALDRTRFCLFSEENNLKAEFLVNDVSKKIIESCQRLNYIIYQDYINEKMLSGSVAFGK